VKQISPCLWFDGQAEQAATFYTSVFPDSRVIDVQRYGPNTPGPEGEVMFVRFALLGQVYGAINGGPQFPHSEAVSFVVPCETTQEIDTYWDALIDGGEPGPCGWLKDRFGVSWQIVSLEADAWMTDPDQEKAQRVTQVMLAGFGKPDVDALRKAYEAG
jgi:predicted 3-demethylubiquinone-9 3-methyltransferase (glyoxalase superfamily)